MQKGIPRQRATQSQSVGVRYISSRSHAMELTLVPKTDSGVFHLHTFINSQLLLSWWGTPW